jgi:hypothetical protein
MLAFQQNRHVNPKIMELLVREVEVEDLSAITKMLKIPYLAEQVQSFLSCISYSSQKDLFSKALDATIAALADPQSIAPVPGALARMGLGDVDATGTIVRRLIAALVTIPAPLNDNSIQQCQGIASSLVHIIKSHKSYKEGISRRIEAHLLTSENPIQTIFLARTLALIDYARLEIPLEALNELKPGDFDPEIVGFLVRDTWTQLEERSDVVAQLIQNEDLQIGKLIEGLGNDGERPGSINQLVDFPSIRSRGGITTIIIERLVKESQSTSRSHEFLDAVVKVFELIIQPQVTHHGGDDAYLDSKFMEGLRDQPLSAVGRTEEYINTALGSGSGNPNLAYLKSELGKRLPAAAAA